MDEPIYVRPGIRGFDYVEPDEFTPTEALRYAALVDNKEEYINVIKEWPSDEALPYDAWANLFRYDSVSCATALLDGEAAGKFNLMAALSDAGRTPLHQAASYGAFKLAAMFLNRGELASTRADYHNLGLKQVLPLDVVLARLRSDVLLMDWPLTKTAFKLLVEFCGSHWRRSLLETLRLLARKEDVNEQFSQYLNDGKMIEVGALLIVGWQPPSTFLQGQNGDPEKEGIVQLLEIFERIGPELLAYITIKRSSLVRWERLAAEIAVLFEDRGLHVKCTEASIFYARRKWFFEDGDSYFNWSKTAKDILRPKYRGYPHDKLALATLNHEHQLSSSYGQQALGASSAKYQGSLINGSRAFHSLSSLKAERNVPSSTQLRISVGKLVRFSSFKQCAAVLMALRRGARHI